MSANRYHTDNHRWITPREITKTLGLFDLDPCADVDQPWSHAEHEWTIETDGLSRDWFGRVWLNPPYGRETAKWLEKLSDHGTGTALVFARTETNMFHEYVWPKASGLLFLKGRLHFHYPSGERAKGNSGGPLVLIAYGMSDAQILQRCGISGTFVWLRVRQ
jgi:hypothetical protein